MDELTRQANETELSYFNMEAYREYQANPVQAWD